MSRWRQHRILEAMTRSYSGPGDRTTRREFITTLAVVALWAPNIRAQVPRKRPLIACLYSGLAATRDDYRAAFLGGMHDLGYVDKENFDISYHYAEGDYVHLPALAEDVVQLSPDVIFAAEPPATAAAKRATQSIPIVAPLLVDPIRQGLVDSYSHPGGNVTGILVAVEGLWTKSVEIARELIPTASTLGLLVNPANPGTIPQRRDVEAAANVDRIKLVVVEAREAVDFDQAFRQLVSAGAQVVLVGADALFVSESRHLAQLALASHIPTVSGTRELTEAGGLVSYNVSNVANYRRAAYFVDKILNGNPPAELPVEFPTKVELVVNRKTAETLGLAIPPTVLARADEVIE